MLTLACLLMQASNILGVQPKPFSPETHVYEQEEYHDQVRRAALHSAEQFTLLHQWDWIMRSTTVTSFQLSVEMAFEVLQDTGKIQVRLADNAIRWRHVQQPDGSTTRESNARFVRWSDGTLQVGTCMTTAPPFQCSAPRKTRSDWHKMHACHELSARLTT